MIVVAAGFRHAHLIIWGIIGNGGRFGNENRPMTATITNAWRMEQQHAASSTATAAGRYGDGTRKVILMLLLRLRIKEVLGITLLKVKREKILQEIYSLLRR